MNVGRSIELGSTVIVVLSFSRTSQGLLKDHAVAVLVSERHAQAGPVVHHVPGLNYSLATLSLTTKLVMATTCTHILQHIE